MFLFLPLYAKRKAVWINRVTYADGGNWTQSVYVASEYAIQYSIASRLLKKTCYLNLGTSYSLARDNWYKMQLTLAWCANSTTRQVHKYILRRYCGNKSSDGTRIWTHNFPTHVFLPKYLLPYRGLHLSNQSIPLYWWPLISKVPNCCH